MPCSVIDLGNGVTAIVRHSGKHHRCYVCGAKCGTLCDFPDPSHKSKTCDRAFCPKHGKNVGKDTDFCAAHAQEKLKL
jgi:hypothetical protein